MATFRKGLFNELKILNFIKIETPFALMYEHNFQNAASPTNKYFSLPCSILGQILSLILTRPAVADDQQR